MSDAAPSVPHGAAVNPPVASDGAPRPDVVAPPAEAPGERLGDRLARGAVEIDEVVEIARMLAVHLEAAHAVGRVDESIVPSRIEVRVGGSPRLLPARAEDRGVRAYTAPEAWNDPGTAASDQFAMAAILYEALCGGRAFPGDDSIKIRMSITTGTVPIAARVPGLAERVDGVFERALAIDPAARYPSCAAFAEALVDAIERSRDEAERVLVKKPTSRPPPGAGVALAGDVWSSGGRAPIPWLKVAVGVLLLVLVLIALVVGMGR